MVREEQRMAEDVQGRATTITRKSSTEPATPVKTQPSPVRGRSGTADIIADKVAFPPPLPKDSIPHAPSYHLFRPSSIVWRLS